MRNALGQALNPGRYETLENAQVKNKAPDMRSGASEHTQADEDLGGSST